MQWSWKNLRSVRLFVVSFLPVAKTNSPKPLEILASRLVSKVSLIGLRRGRQCNIYWEQVSFLKQKNGNICWLHINTQQIDRIWVDILWLILQYLYEKEKNFVKCTQYHGTFYISNVFLSCFLYITKIVYKQAIIAEYNFLLFFTISLARKHFSRKRDLCREMTIKLLEELLNKKKRNCLLSTDVARCIWVCAFLFVDLIMNELRKSLRVFMTADYYKATMLHYL